MNNTKIGTVSAIFLIITIMINHIILNIPKSILRETGSSSPLNILYVSILAILLTLLICRLFKKFPGSDILDVSNFLFGKWFKFLIGLLFIIYLLSTGSVLLRDFSEGLKIIYFKRTQIYFIIALFVIVAAFCNNLGEKSIIRSNLLILPIVLAGIIFIFLANIKNFVPQKIFPILGDGVNSTFITGTSNLYAFSCLFLIYFIPPYLKDTSKFKKVAITSIVISSIYLLLCIFSLICMFSFITTENEIMPIYLASRYIEFGTFFQRVDALFLLIWILEVSLYLNVVVMLSIKIFKKITNIENSSNMIYPICMLVFCFSLIPRNLADVNTFNETFYKNITLYFVIITSLVILILANIKNKIKNKNKEEILT